MFVRSNMSVPVTYNKSTGSIVLKPQTVTFIDESIVTAKELKDCYGDRISILTQDVVDTIIKEASEVEEEAAEVEEEIVEDETTEIVNTGDEAVDNFLNGETDELPEGTQEISEEEALKLKETAEAKEEIKEDKTEKVEKKAEAKKDEVKEEKQEKKPSRSRGQNKTNTKRK